MKHPLNLNLPPTLKLRRAKQLNLFLTLAVLLLFGTQSARACDPTSSTLKVSACDFYIVPSGKHTVRVIGLYMMTDTILNSAGCDSVIFIQLTLHNLTAYHHESGDSLMASYATDAYQWIDCENGPISNATNKTFYPSSSGYYALIMKQGDCVDTSDCAFFSFNGMGIGDAFDAGIRIYPNPAKNLSIVEAPGEVQVSLYTMDGRLIDAFVPAQRTELDVKNLAEGTYFIRIHASESVYSRKLVVVR